MLRAFLLRAFLFACVFVLFDYFSSLSLSVSSLCSFSYFVVVSSNMSRFGCLWGDDDNDKKTPFQKKPVCGGMNFDYYFDGIEWRQSNEASNRKKSNQQGSVPIRGGMENSIRGGATTTMSTSISTGAFIANGGLGVAGMQAIQHSVRGGIQGSVCGGTVRGGIQGSVRGGTVRGGMQGSVRGGTVRGGMQGSVRGGMQGSVRGGMQGFVHGGMQGFIPMRGGIIRGSYSQPSRGRCGEGRGGGDRTYNSIGRGGRISNVISVGLVPPAVLNLNLPVMEHVDAILEMYTKEKIMVLSASTGSGKSSILPAELALRNPGKFILVVIPTVSACNMLARRVQSQYPNLNIGSAAGNIIRYDENTQLVFATGGHIVNMLFQHKSFRHFTDVIFDEAHTVSIDYELFTALVQHYELLSQVNMMIVTATFYKAIVKPWEILHGSPIERFDLNVPMFDIVETFTDEDIEDDKKMELAIVDYLMEQNEKMEEGHFLVFCPGEEMIDSLYKKMQAESAFANCDVFCAYSSQPMEENDRAFHQTKQIKGDFQRSIVLATNIAETSVTIPGIVLVVDTGKQKIVTIGENDAVKLMTVDVSAFGAKQRAGRTGRTNKGIVHRMYSRYQKESFSSTYSPELQRTPLTQIVLKFLSFEVCPVEVLGKYSADKEIMKKMVGTSWIPKNEIELSIRRLKKFGLIKDDKPTTEALAISGMTLRLPLRRCLYQVQKANQRPLSTEDKIFIASIAIAEVEATQTLQFYRRQQKEESSESFQAFLSLQENTLERFKEDVCCPLNISLNVFLSCCDEVKQNGLFDWCRANSINSKAMLDIKTCLFRMGYHLNDFMGLCRNNREVSIVFKNTTIPRFVAGYVHQDMEFTELHDGKWFTDHRNDCFYRLNRRGFGSGFQLGTNCILALAISEVGRDSGKDLCFVSVYVPLKPKVYQVHSASIRL